VTLMQPDSEAGVPDVWNPCLYTVQNGKFCETLRTQEHQFRGIIF